MAFAAAKAAGKAAGQSAGAASATGEKAMPTPIRLAASALVCGAMAFGGYWYIYRDANIPSYQRVPDPFIRDIFSGHKRKWPNVPDEVIARLRNRGAALKHLDLVGSIAANDEVLSNAAHYCPELESFAVADTMGRVTDEGLTVLALGCPKLKVVDMVRLGGTVTDGGIAVIAKQLQHLEACRACDIGPDGLSSLAVMSLVAHNKGLKYLNVCGELSNLTNEGLLHVAEFGKHLVTLEMASNDAAFDSDGVRAVLKGCEKLQLLDVTGRCGIDDDLIYDIASGEYGKSLKVLKVKTKATGGPISETAVADLRLIRPSLYVYTDEELTKMYQEF